MGPTLKGMYTILSTGDNRVGCQGGLGAVQDSKSFGLWKVLTGSDSDFVFTGNWPVQDKYLWYVKLA